MSAYTAGYDLHIGHFVAGPDGVIAVTADAEAATLVAVALNAPAALQAVTRERDEAERKLADLRFPPSCELPERGKKAIREATDDDWKRYFDLRSST